MLSKGGNKHMRTLNNTEGGGGERECVSVCVCMLARKISAPDCDHPPPPHPTPQNGFTPLAIPEVIKGNCIYCIIIRYADVI